MDLASMRPTATAGSALRVDLRTLVIHATIRPVHVEIQLRAHKSADFVGKSQVCSPYAHTVRRISHTEKLRTGKVALGVEIRYLCQGRIIKSIQEAI